MTQFVSGARLGPYQIEAPLAAGGMGEVFRAIDTRLGRAVAIKACHEQFSERFTREARAISSLNHPHICTLYDLGQDYLVMELLEGETLATRLLRGKLSLEQTILYGSQIADALDAAHIRGIVHRDLKPHNIMLTKSGVKVLDFGLAKSPDDETVTVYPAVIGTPAYMAPEQREGKECTAESDIYSLGLILQEMVTGKRAKSYAPSELGQGDRRLAHLIERCLATDRQDRWHSARDLKFELEWARRESTASPAAAAPSRVRPAAFVGACLIGLVGLLFGFLEYRQPRSSEPLLRLAITAPQGAEIREGSAISPDGRAVVFVARASGADKLWIRPLESVTAHELTGTEGATYPFWSPDSRFVAFFAVGKLKRIDVNSGVTEAICEIGLGRGGSWNEQGTILFNSVNDGPLLSVAATGGSPAPVTTIDTARGENSHRFPYFLPDGRRFLFYVRAPDPNVAGVYLGSLDTPQQKKRLMGSPTAAVLASGMERGPAYLAWVDNGNLMARPFDIKTGEMRGEAGAVGGPARSNLPNRYGDVSVSRNGTLVYATGVTPAQRITSFDRSGKALDTIGPPDAYEGIRLSPDGTRIAVSRGVTSSHSAGIAVLEIARGIASPVVSGFWGSWSHDGQRIAYGTSPSGAPNLYTMSTSGNGDRERLTDSPNSQRVIDWSPDDGFILYAEQPNDVAAVTESGLWVLRLADRKPSLIVKTAHRQAHGQFSMDGRWIAYTSTESGRAEIWVQSFPAGHAKRQVSSTGGDYPRWRGDTRELFYVKTDQTLMSVAVHQSADTIEFARPVQLFKVSMRSGTTAGPEVNYPYDVVRDGQRILGFTAAGDAEPQTLVMISNVPAELRNPATYSTR